MAEPFQGDDEEGADEHPDEGGEDLRIDERGEIRANVNKCLDANPGLFGGLPFTHPLSHHHAELVAPRPDLDQGTEGETDQGDQRRPFVMCYQPVQKFGEGGESDHAADSEHDEHRPVELADGRHDIFILPEENQDEAS